MTHFTVCSLTFVGFFYRLGLRENCVFLNINHEIFFIWTIKMPKETLQVWKYYWSQIYLIMPEILHVP